MKEHRLSIYKKVHSPHSKRGCINQISLKVRRELFLAVILFFGRQDILNYAHNLQRLKKKRLIKGSLEDVVVVFFFVFLSHHLIYLLASRISA